MKRGQRRSAGKNAARRSAPAGTVSDATACPHGDCETPDECMNRDDGCNSDECDQLRARLADLLTRTANALKGEPEPLKSHSWHDLPEVAAATVTQAVDHGRLAKKWETACLAADAELRQLRGGGSDV